MKCALTRAQQWLGLDVATNSPESPEPTGRPKLLTPIEHPDVEGVTYTREDLDDGTVVVTVAAKPGYALTTGHRERDPHEAGKPLHQ